MYLVIKVIRYFTKDIEKQEFVIIITNEVRRP